MRRYLCKIRTVLIIFEESSAVCDHSKVMKNIMINPKLQKSFFDEKENTYPQDQILNPPSHAALEFNEIFKRINKSSDNEVAEFGAGSGRISIPLLKCGFKVYAIDISEKSLLDLKYLAETLNLFGLKTLDKLPKNKTFNNIVGADILHHLNLDETLPILYKSLKVGGKIVFSEPSAFNLSWYLYLPFASSWEVERGLTNLRYYNIVKKLKKYGFNKITITGLGLLPRPIFLFSKQLCSLNDRLGNLPIFKLFAYRYIIEATKVKSK